MLPVAAALLAWGVSGPAAARVAASAEAPPAAPAAVPGAPGAVVTPLDFPMPRALPCRRFETFQLEVGADAQRISGEPGASLSWTAAARTLSLSSPTGQALSEPLTPFMLPTRAQLSTPAAVGAARITFFCRRYDITTHEGQMKKDADPFLGIRWFCKKGTCQPDVGYALPKNLAVSPGRLRLCAKESDKSWKESYPSRRPCHDIAPALDDRTKALALAGEVMADARRTLTDACRIPDSCGPLSRTVMANLRPTRWRPTTYSGAPAGLHLTAETDDRKLALSCSREKNGDARCDLILRDSTGHDLVFYTPIQILNDPAQAILEIPGQAQLWMTSAPSELKDKAEAGTSISGALLQTR